MKSRLIVAALWLLSLLGVAAATAAGQRSYQSLREPEVISGADIGFRVDRDNGDTPVGELVVRRNGKWVAVEFGARLKVMR
jgi:hypothetical protein